MGCSNRWGEQTEPGFRWSFTLALAAWAVTRPAEIPFALRMIDPGAFETCAIADINRDGHPDIVSGENWYEGPNWIKHPFRSVEYYRNATEDLTDLVLDVNGDGYPDVISSASHGSRIWWNENPGASGGQWKEHLIEADTGLSFRSKACRPEGLSIPPAFSCVAT